jgi:hypothetical protein
MARGWESKAVEEQQGAERDTSPAAAQAKARGNATRDRAVQELLLQRERILAERTASPHRRAALQAALADMERQLSELGVVPAPGD